MNTELMLRIADEIESRPEGYDQVNGVFELHRESECAVCVAGHAVRLQGRPYAADEWANVANSAQDLLELSDEHARELFSARPNADTLIDLFPWVSEQDLDTLDELERWTLDADAFLHPLKERAEPEQRVPFTLFWCEQVPEEHAAAHRRSSALVMAATLRLIARNREESGGC